MSQYISGQLESVATAGSPDSVFSKKRVHLSPTRMKNYKKNYQKSK